MTIKMMRFSMALLISVFFALLQAACSSKFVSSSPTAIPSTETQISTPAQTNTLIPQDTPLPTKKPIPTVTRFFASSTPMPTTDFTQEAMYVMVTAAARTEQAINEKAADEKATQIAQFPEVCDDILFPNISPDGNWFAASCGYKRDQTLIVQSKDGVKWVFTFEDFLHPDTSKEIMGALYPKFWDPEGEFLYFAVQLGYDVGGNECFRGYGDHGLFRLSLKTGSWTTLFPTSNAHTGYEIQFSPTGRYYALDSQGVTITDLETDEVHKIDATGVMDLSWSPDGQYLAYSVASCGEQFVESSSVYFWDALTDQTQVLMTIEEILLRPESWINNSTLRVVGERVVGLDVHYTFYEHQIPGEDLIATVTPSP